MTLPIPLKPDHDLTSIPQRDSVLAERSALGGR
jgi:hypothetical protein